MLSILSQRQAQWGYFDALRRFLYAVGGYSGIPVKEKERMRNTVTTGKEILSEKSKKGCQNIRYQKIMRTPNRIRSSHYSRLAQRKGFEPLYELPHNMISNHARSTAPPSLQQPIYYNAFDYKKQVFLPMFSFLF